MPILAQQPASVVIANRTVAKAETLVEEFSGCGGISACGFANLHGQQFDLVLNATSASLSDQLPPLPDDLLAEHANCYDLAYGNQPTAFVNWAIAHGAGKSLDGLGMLVEQAAEAFQLWRGIRPATAAVIAQLDRERSQG